MVSEFKYDVVYNSLNTNYSNAIGTFMLRKLGEGMVYGGLHADTSWVLKLNQSVKISKTI